MSIKVVHLSNYDVALNIHLKNYLCYLRDQAYDVKIVCSPGKILKGDGVTDYGIPVESDSILKPIHPWSRFKNIVAALSLLSPREI